MQGTLACALIPTKGPVSGGVDAAPAQLLYTPASPEVRALADADPRLGALADAVGDIRVRLEADRFVSLGRAMVGQQLSAKAAETIWSRVAAIGPFSPDGLMGTDDGRLRGAGLSGSKLAYLRDLATRILTGDVDLDGLDALPDEDVIADITRVKGIGRWTAQMFLVFSLGRPDVLALEDAGLLRSGGWLLGSGRPAEPAALAAAGEAWRPLRSVASLYLWGALDKGLVPRTGQPGGLSPRAEGRSA